MSITSRLKKVLALPLPDAPAARGELCGLCGHGNTVYVSGRISNGAGRVQSWANWVQIWTWPAGAEAAKTCAIKACWRKSKRPVVAISSGLKRGGQADGVCEFHRRFHRPAQRWSTVPLIFWSKPWATRAVMHVGSLCSVPCPLGVFAVEIEGIFENRMTLPRGVL